MTTDFEFIEGETHSVIFECYRSNGEPIDLQYATSIVFGCTKYGNTDYRSIFAKALNSGITITDTNKLEVKFNPYETIEAAGKYSFTLSITSGENVSSQKGFFTIINTDLGPGEFGFEPM